MNKSKSLSWNDRFALIDHFQPTDQMICETFGITYDELDTARSLRSTGTFTPSVNLDVESYKGLFKPSSTNIEPSVPTPRKDVNVTTNEKPLTASKKNNPPKKRGRKGNKIQKAFEAVTETPVPAEDFAKEHNVSLSVLRQNKRFDKTGLAPIRVKKIEGKLMIWRDEA